MQLTSTSLLCAQLGARPGPRPFDSADLIRGAFGLGLAGGGARWDNRGARLILCGGLDGRAGASDMRRSRGRARLGFADRFGREHRLIARAPPRPRLVALHGRAASRATPPCLSSPNMKRL